ncbi:VOC family protein [Cohnella panacarvi]|uniref:VOC family protein n=1 Tax=Cohnella panacarvi TaxID=400776 RepID=UPI00047B037C|nr:VOC family protein [Cohnella panacarvi]
MSKVQRITPSLWFGNQAEEAINLYVSIFDNSKIVQATRFREGGPGPEGTLMSAIFELEGQRFMALNGGPQFAFSEAISFFVSCDTQEEIDDLWAKLTANGGEEGRCGWLKDKFGVSWQIIPSVLGDMLNDEDADKAQRAMRAMLQMNKLDIQRLVEAYQG